MANSGVLPKLNSPTDYDLQDIILITSTGAITLKPQLVELNFFEDIFAGTISAQVVVSDAVGLIRGLSLNGTEYVTIKLDKPESPGVDIQRTFRLFSITARSLSINNTFETYTLNLCSDEFMLSEQYRISKSYKGKSISFIIKDILTRFLGVGTDSTKSINIEDTLNEHDFILPNKKIFETINWLATYATPKKSGGSGTGNNQNGADMIFFENNDGFFFSSLSSLYDQEPTFTYTFAPKNIKVNKNIVDQFQQDVTNIMNIEVLDSFDTLRAAMNGTFSNRVITFDPLLRKKYVTDFSYDELAGKQDSLNGSPITNNYKNRFDQAMYEPPITAKGASMEAGVLRLAPSNQNQLNQSSYIKQTPDTAQKDINAENYIPNRVGQLALSQYQRVRITVPGNPQLFAGMTTFLNVYGVSETTENKERPLDPHLSGKYLVSTVRHVINNTQYISVVELCKDSNLEAYARVNNDDTVWGQIVKGDQKILVGT